MGPNMALEMTSLWPMPFLPLKVNVRKLKVPTVSPTALDVILATEHIAPDLPSNASGVSSAFFELPTFPPPLSAFLKRGNSCVPCYFARPGACLDSNVLGATPARVFAHHLFNDAE